MRLLGVLVMVLMDVYEVWSMRLKGNAGCNERV